MSNLREPSPSKYVNRAVHGVPREFYRRLIATGLPWTTCCASCGRADFPPRETCPRCSEPTSWTQLPANGSLYAFTTQETALRFAAPVVFALAELGGVVVPGIVECPYKELAIGQAITTSALVTEHSVLPVIRFELIA